jgi:Na+/H+ antiporter NhaA
MTVWSRGLAEQLRRYVRAESASSTVLLGAIVVALVWATASVTSYAAVWDLDLSIRVGDTGIGMSLQEWISKGLMTFFFLIVGLEARREFDLGTLRDRRQLIIPVAAGLAGMAVPIAIFLAVNAGGPGSAGWGAAMSTDTALALGLLALVGRALPEQVRAFVVTVFIVDDLVALLIIAFVYSDSVHVIPLIIAIAAFTAFPIMLRWSSLPSLAYLVAGVACWVALYESGIDPLVCGLAIGLVAPAYTPGRADLAQAAGLYRSFREQPTPRLARSAGAGLIGTLSPNERLQSLYAPVTTFVIVPLFALSNAGVDLAGEALPNALGSPITLGIILAFVIGKPVAVLGTSLLVAASTRGGVKPPVGWVSVGASGTIAGVGFTVSVLIASLAFTGRDLTDAKIGVLAAAVISSLVTWLLVQTTRLLSARSRARALIGDGDAQVDLSDPVDPARDHIRGPIDAPVTIVEYGDFECPYCGRAEPAVAAMRTDKDVRFVWRHLPLREVHKHALAAALAAEAAAEQGAFWELHDLLLERQDDLTDDDLRRYAEELGLDVEAFMRAMHGERTVSRVHEDLRSADASGVTGTPTFFINGRRHYGAYDEDSLRAAVRAAMDAASRA